MEMQGEKRAYVRDTDFYSEAKISGDKKNWHTVNILDISASGIRFVSDIALTVGEILWFDLTVQNFMAESVIRTRGAVRRKEKDKTRGTVYGVSFEDLDPGLGIRIDEMIIRKARYLHKSQADSFD